MNISCSSDRNIFDAATHGATVSAKLVAAIVVNVIAFLSLLEFVNVTLIWFGERVGVEDFTLEVIICLSSVISLLCYAKGYQKDTEGIFKLIRQKQTYNAMI